MLCVCVLGEKKMKESKRNCTQNTNVYKSPSGLVNQKRNKRNSDLFEHDTRIASTLYKSSAAHMYSNFLFYFFSRLRVHVCKFRSLEQGLMCDDTFE